MNLDGKLSTQSHGKMEDVNLNVSINSVYNLITKLCEKLLNSQKSNISNKLIKKYRSNAYEILLSKRIFENVNSIVLEDNNDPYCYLLAWQYVLINQHNLPEHAQKLQKCINTLVKSSSLNEKVLSDVLYVMFKLCKLPEQNNVISINNSALHTLENVMKFRYFDSDKFKLSVPMICSESKFSNESFLLRTNRNIQTYKCIRSGYSEADICKDCHIPLRISCSSSECIIKADDECRSHPEEEQCDIWDLVSKTEFCDHRTWETLGNSHPTQEAPFLTDAPSSVCSNLYKMHASNIIQLLGESTNVKLSVTTEQKCFISDVKNLLVGIASHSFKRDSHGVMYLEPGSTIEGVTAMAMDSYCKDLLLCSSCYTALDNLCNSSAMEECHRQGFIFKELCDSINRYLAYYRLAIQNISESTNLLSVHNYIKPLLSHLTVLASVCRVGPFKVPQSYLPDGVLLINYLYQQTAEVTEKHVIMVLYSILYPCIQIYFNRFIQQWIFEGTINDPYGEFFIGHDPAYARAKGRTYWTRCHKTKLELIPDFLDDVTQEILACGKALNLLKLCVPSSPLCLYLMGKKPNLLSCCLSSEQIQALERNSVSYYLEVMAECGPRFQVDHFISRKYEQSAIFMDLIMKKRAATLKRLELEKLKRFEEELEKKRKGMAVLKQQYDEALQNKKLQLIAEIETEMKSNEEILKMQNLRQKLIAEEALDLIEYYDKLNDISDKRRRDILNHIEKLKRIDLDSSNLSSRDAPKAETSNTSVVSAEDDDKIELPSRNKLDEENSPTSSYETFLSAESESAQDEEEHEVPQEPDDDHESKTEMHSSTSLDIINANSEGDTNVSEVARRAAENFEIARRNRAKVLTEEMGMAPIEPKRQEIGKPDCISAAPVLTDLERNRLKVMSSEFGLRVAPKKAPPKKEMSYCEINRRKNMTSNECFRGSQDEEEKEKNEHKEFINTTAITNILDQKNLGSKTDLTSSCCNENYLNVNNANFEDNGNINMTIKEENGNDNVEDRIKEQIKVEEKNLLNKSFNDNTKNNNLKLDFSKLTNLQQSKPKNTESIFSRFLKSPNFELDKPIPMSLGSTPCVDSASYKMQSSVDKDLFENIESGATTATTNFTDEGFNFRDVHDTNEPLLFMQKYRSSKILDKTPISKRVSSKDAANISTRSIRVFIEQSVSIPLTAQLKLVNNELLKYFFVDLQLLTHLNSLRNYFFLSDGEFGRNITEGLFEKLYDVNFPIDLINCRTLQHLVYNAIVSSIKHQENSGCLSFKINSLPKTFNLEDPDVLECLSLTYKVDWPMNVLLPSDTIAKYDDVFKFLLKLNRISWVLKKILQDLKLLSKKSGKREAFLVLSTQFQKLHHHRHIMTHFVQALQNYVVGEVLQTSWAAFEKKLMTVSNIDEIYSLHVAYIKNILFMCLLNQRSIPIQKLILKIFTVILKFYNYLRMADWVFDDEDGAYEHPNFKKLEDIFQNFEELAAYFVKAADKVAKVGYQPNLSQLLDMLNVNDYYLNRIASRTSSSTSTLGSSNFESVSSNSL